MTDGGRPSGDGLQEQSPNCPELHRLRAYVVSVREKAFLRGGQVWVEEMNESEPLDEVSKNAYFQHQNRGDNWLIGMSTAENLFTGCAVLGTKAA